MKDRLMLTVKVTTFEADSPSADRPASLIGSDGEAHGHYLVEDEARAIADLWNGHDELPALLVRIESLEAEKALYEAQVQVLSLAAWNCPAVYDPSHNPNCNQRRSGEGDVNDVCPKRYSNDAERPYSCWLKYAESEAASLTQAREEGK